MWFYVEKPKSGAWQEFSSLACEAGNTENGDRYTGLEVLFKNKERI